MATGSGEVAIGGHIGQPTSELVCVFYPFRPLEQRITGQGLVAAPQILDALGALPEADVWNRVQEATDVRHHAVLGRVGPELAGYLKLLADAHRFGDIDRTVRQLRCVEQLAQTGVSGAGVVPRVAAFGCGTVEPLDHGDRPVRLQAAQ